MTWIKICGLRRSEDVSAAVDAGADALGFNFWTGTSRYIDPADAARMIESLPSRILPVGVFVDSTPAHMLRVAEITGIRAIQLHGEESPEALGALGAFKTIKAIKISEKLETPKLQAFQKADIILLDRAVNGMPGGTGLSFNWSLAIEAKKYGTILLAGGLNPDNVADAIREVQPWGVDVASGVEAGPGVKDPVLIRDFIRNAREAFEPLT